MAIIPASYDPYNNISFLELNKKRRGESTRPEEDRIYNRGPPPVKKLFLRLNGDFTNKPKRYVWKVWQVRELENLVADMGSFLGIEARELYDERGRRITDVDQVGDGQTYTVVGDEHYDGGRFPERSGTKATDSRVNRAKNRVIEGGEYDRAYREAMDDAYTINYNEFAPPEIKTPAPTDYLYDDEDDWREYYRSQPESTASRYTDPGPSRKANSTNSLPAERRSRKAPRRTEQPRMQRSHSAVIFNRRDQTHPDAYIIYVFLNGRGMESRFMKFQKAQLQRGLNYVLELIARGYSINPAKLCNMDGSRIRDVSELMSRGAYVIVPVGQNFRDTWYFLPDNAIDTSSNRNKVRERSAQRDRLIQKHERRQAGMKGGVVPSHRTRQLPIRQAQPLPNPERASRLTDHDARRPSEWNSPPSQMDGGRRSYSMDPRIPSEYSPPPQPVATNNPLSVVPGQRFGHIQKT